MVIATLLCLSGLQFCPYITLRYLAPLRGRNLVRNTLPLRAFRTLEIRKQPHHWYFISSPK